MFTAVPIGVAIARFVPIARTTHHGTGLIPIVSAMEITIGDIRAATVLFCRNRDRTLESTQITTVKTTTDAFAPPNILRTVSAITAPPPETSSPVPMAVTAPIQIRISHGRSRRAFFTGTQPVRKRTTEPSIAIFAMLK